MHTYPLWTPTISASISISQIGDICIIVPENLPSLFRCVFLGFLVFSNVPFNRNSYIF